MRRRLVILLVLAALGAAAGATSPAAAQTAPCWKVLLNDWYDGQIDNTYPARCYREAIRRLPDDVEAYTEAREDIERALLAAVRRSGGQLADDQLIPPPPGSGRDSARDADDGKADGDQTPGDNGIPDDDEGDDIEQTASPGPGGGDSGAPGFFRPSNADEIPLPLILLAGLAILLLAAASAGFVARRLQARRLRPAPLSSRSTPPDA